MSEPSLVQVNKSNGFIWRLSLAILCVTLGTGPLLFLLFLKVVEHGHGKSLKTYCASNMNQIGLVIAMYAEQHNNTIPRRFENL